MSAAIEVQSLSKKFHLYHEKYSSLKERALHAGRVPYEEFWALRDINVEVAQGKTVGILGRNGSGKSTLLKCIAGILQPTSGRVVLRGQLAAMLELGAGFHPELSGRDNIFLNGSLLGFSRREIARRFDAIVAFAELEQFIDNQVKYYSSGMYVRLGFSVAVNTDPDVLLIDEVLAVGDERFQQKCLNRVKEFQEQGRTIIVVSHSADVMRPICDEILVMERGAVVALAPAGEAIRAYREVLVGAGVVPPDPLEDAGGKIEVLPLARRPVELGTVSREYLGAEDHPYLHPSDPLAVRVEFEVTEQIDDVSFGISVLSEAGDVIFAEVRHAIEGGGTFDPGAGSVTFVFSSIPLLDGRFNVNIDVRNEHGIVIDLAEPACDFEVVNPTPALGGVAMPFRIECVPPDRRQRGIS